MGDWEEMRKNEEISQGKGKNFPLHPCFFPSLISYFPLS